MKIPEIRDYIFLKYLGNCGFKITPGPDMRCAFKPTI